MSEKSSVSRSSGSTRGPFNVERKESEGVGSKQAEVVIG